jgi:hypothetical protein
MSTGPILAIAIAATGILMMRFRKRWLARFTGREKPPGAHRLGQPLCAVLLEHLLPTLLQRRAVALTLLL